MQISDSAYKGVEALLRASRSACWKQVEGFGCAWC